MLIFSQGRETVVEEQKEFQEYAKKVFELEKGRFPKMRNEVWVIRTFCFLFLLNFYLYILDQALHQRVLRAQTEPCEEVPQALLPPAGNEGELDQAHSNSATGSPEAKVPFCTEWNVRT